MIEIKKLDKSQVEIKVSVIWDDWKSSLDAAVEEISKEVKIEGFRPGKAPREMVENKVGKDAILNSAAEKAIKKNYPGILEKEKIEAIGAPQVEIIKITEGAELEYMVVATVMPEVKMEEWKDEVGKVNKKHEKEEAEISDEEIQKEIKKLAESRVKLVTVNREAKDGDNVELDFEVKRDGIPIENGTSKKHNLILGKGVFIPGFEDNIIGMKAGDEKEFELSFPEGYHAKDLAGKPAQFKVKVNIVQKRETPEVNDDFAKSLGKFESLNALKENMKEGMIKEKKQRQKEQKRAEIVEELIKKVKVDLPQLLIDEEMQKMIGEFEMQIQGMGMTLDQYLGQMKKNKEDLMKDWIPQAEKRIKSAMALEAIIKEKEIEVPADKIEEELNRIMAQYKGVKDIKKNIDLKNLYNYAKSMLANEEAFKLLEKI